jgi:hypothetical protein
LTQISTPPSKFTASPAKSIKSDQWNGTSNNDCCVVNPEINDNCPEAMIESGCSEDDTESEFSTGTESSADGEEEGAGWVGKDTSNYSWALSVADASATKDNLIKILQPKHNSGGYKDPKLPRVLSCHLELMQTFLTRMGENH